MTEYHQQSSAEVMKILNVTTQGLTDDDVQKRQQVYGYNVLEEGKKTSTLAVFMGQFKDLLVIILLVAAFVSFLLGEVESTIVIMIVVILNAILGTVQHVKAEQSLDNLKALTSPIAKVMRHNQLVEIPSEEIVVGDLLMLEAGDYINADGRLLESHNLHINESSLTGESIAVAKSTDPIRKQNITIADKKNMVYSGSFVTNGRGIVMVTAIGMQTEIGKIANLLDTAKEKKTPLQISLDQFGEKLALGITLICLAIFTIDLIRGRALVESFMFAVSLAVAAIPEALSSIVTIVLAFGTQKMAKENAIIRKLYAVESLGSVSVICSDKTGTLTENKMVVQEVFVDQKKIPHDWLNPINPVEKELMVKALLCSDAVERDHKEIGDPTEIALVKLGKQYGLDELKIREQYPRLAEIPFDSTRKLMSTVNQMDKQPIMITKGALDVLLPKVTRIKTSTGIFEITPQHRQKIEAVNRDFSMNGLRVLAIAYKEVLPLQKVDPRAERDLIFVGLVAMMDPPRKESKEAVESCIKAGIKPVMITGDHKITATAIAEQIGILQNPAEAIEGHALEGLTDQELQDKVQDYSVYARVTPAQKIRIVKAWQDKGHVVAMTGDGVNDGPALKQADIGVAMGVTGTEVAKDASSMILTDDNFSTIVKAIANGRSIYTNIKNAILFLLSGNAGAIFVVLYATVLGLPVPFAPVHLLFINLLTDSLPAIAIGLEPNNKKTMKDKPRNIHTPLLNKKFTTQVVLEGILIAISTIIAFQIGLSTGDTLTASTMAFTTLCLSRLVHGFNSRSKQSIFAIGVFSNKYTWFAFIIGVLSLHMVLFMPMLTTVFEVAPLTPAQLGFIYSLSVLPFLVNQWYKLLFVRNR
ncbi:cation-translocating P-type ATPase [Lysinibacillus sp. HST-98]|uniref:cation-translocating P-type ATPase n=1 Tax=Lysinibacillus TaxID=400634 RepID=UPI0001DA589C|nr:MULTISPECIES: cation-translocating P-type ATPase [Lysinibacillus]EFI67593.1 cation-transporting ATPase, P-type [Lysinibacillus fusiformis ZC1]EKU44788.1 cation-transporting ATPase, P-type [Lysinibacillus fusiformis ZB2]MBL3728195.1 cation-translocating P-type ATPase [Lysinibacillus sp. HST-98]MBU5253446.1 cation-translocating P-type ATPase [Lysinibacillus capsici]MED4699014.1 cation-translocating P-type ATPase [Lysinibacillus capsici]